MTMGIYNNAINGLKGLGSKTNSFAKGTLIGTTGVAAGVVGAIPGVIAGGLVGGAFDNGKESDFATLGSTAGAVVGFLSARKFAANGTRSFVNKFWR